MSTHNGNRRGIYAITDEPTHSYRSWLAQAEAALEGGVVMMQFRSKILNPTAKKQYASGLLALCRQANVPLIINDDVALCRDLQADGVHLGRKDTDLPRAREILGVRSIIGASCNNSIARARMARSLGANYVAFGRFFASTTKPDAPAATTTVLTAAKQALDIPVVAIGGINVDNGAPLISAGADMLAVISGLFGSDDITGCARALADLFKTANSKDTATVVCQ